MDLDAPRVDIQQTLHLKHKPLSEKFSANLAFRRHYAKIIEDIMVDPENRPEIRLKAAQDILHRTGHDKPKEVNVNQTVSDLSAMCVLCVQWWRRSFPRRLRF